LGRDDVDDLLSILKTDGVELHALEVSRCGLSDLVMRDILEALLHRERMLQSLSISRNPARIHASFVQHIVHNIADLRKLDVSHSIMAGIDGPLLSFDDLMRFQNLEELDLSGYKVRLYATAVEFVRLTGCLAQRRNTRGFGRIPEPQCNTSTSKSGRWVSGNALTWKPPTTPRPQQLRRHGMASRPALQLDAPHGR
jgi:hypothetical protein